VLALLLFFKKAPILFKIVICLNISVLSIMYSMVSIHIVSYISSCYGYRDKAGQADLSIMNTMLVVVSCTMFPYLHSTTIREKRHISSKTEARELVLL